MGDRNKLTPPPHTHRSSSFSYKYFLIKHKHTEGFCNFRKILIETLLPLLQVKYHHPTAGFYLLQIGNRNRKTIQMVRQVMKIFTAEIGNYSLGMGFLLERETYQLPVHIHFFSVANGDSFGHFMLGRLLGRGRLKSL